MAVQYLKQGNTNFQGSLLLDPIAAADVPTPAAGFIALFNNASNSNKLSVKNSSNVVVEVAAPVSFSTLAILYGTDATGCVWTSNMLAVNHALNTTTPEVLVWVLNSVSGKYEMANVPHAVIDANNVQMDFSGCTGLTFNIKIK